jgi:fumarate reductase iron-sulfur subunit
MPITLVIQRNPEVYDQFSVPYREGMLVLDALKHVGHIVPDLAYRWECGQGICGVCTLTINDAPALACTALVQDNASYVLEPLAGFPAEKDLLINVAPRLEQMQTIAPYLIEGGRPIASKAEADQSKLLRSCIECGACVSVCPVSREPDHADALSMVKLARFALDPRDGADRREIAAEHGLDVYAATCPSCRACMDVCPKGIDVFIHAVQMLADKSDR